MRCVHVTDRARSAAGEVLRRSQAAASRGKTGGMSSVQVITTPSIMSAWSEAARARGERIAFVPTMGALHAGHVSLLSAARRGADRVVLSIFVNPTQFGPKEDLASYPRDLDGDLAKAESAGTDVAFVPEAKDVYPTGAQTFVDVREVSRGLCGECRPGHFTGVATVVCKLFNIVRPHLAIFGEKDFQQLAVIRRMVVDLNMSVDIVGEPTLREPDGLAMSSRNAYLSPAERARALAISQGLSSARDRLAAGERDAAVLVAATLAVIKDRVDRIDYVEIRDADSLRPVERLDRPAVILAAAYVGATRLIDNMRLG
jgi:pantoate--beta-alanine ligase